MELEFIEGYGWELRLDDDEIEKKVCMNCKKKIQAGDYFCVNVMRPVCYKCEILDDVGHVKKLRCHLHAKGKQHEHRKICSIKFKEVKKNGSTSTSKKRN